METGWEATLMVRLLASGSADSATLLREFQPKLKAPQMEALGLTKEQLVEAFNETRSAWIKEDEEGWLASHDFYPEAVAAVKHLVATNEDVYIITTKDAKFAKRLLAKVEVSIPDSKVYGLGSGKKWNTLQSLLGEAGRAEDTRAFFLEDRLKALEEVLEEVDGRELVRSKTDLAFATWGYNGQRERDIATSKGMAVLDEAAFLALARGHAVA